MKVKVSYAEAVKVSRIEETQNKEGECSEEQVAARTARQENFLVEKTKAMIFTKKKIHGM